GGPGSGIAVFPKSGSRLGWNRFCKTTDLLNPEWKLVVDGAVKILCEIWVYGDLKQTLRKGRGAYLSSSHSERVKVSKDEIANDLGKLFRESIGTDVAIVCSQTNFKVHKSILSARSPVFAAMFNSDMVESRSNFVQIEDFEDDVVKGMLEHLYTGKTDSMDELAPELLRIAEKYDLGGLKADCVYKLGNKLNWKMLENY
ncbi:Speckle-type POZ protein, partial [Orchesella cincta]